MKKPVIFIMLLAVATFGFAGLAKADSFTGSGNIIWTLNNNGPYGSGGFLVTLIVDASNPAANAGTSTFNTMAVQFFNGGNSATGATLVGTTNPPGWDLDGFGNVNQCGSGNLPFNCFDTTNDITITGGHNSGVYTFLFDVTGLNGAPDTGDVQALQGSLPGSNGKYSISQTFALPEPATLTLLGFGLIGVPFLRRKRS